MSKVSDLLRKARDVRVMAENAGSDAASHRLRMSAHRLERAAEDAAKARTRSERPRTQARQQG
jgi:hypothetical protein